MASEISPNEKTRRMRSLAVMLMLTAALFSGVVMGVMLITHFSEPPVPPVSPTIQSLQAALAKDPTNEALKEALRQEDQQARQSYLTNRRRFSAGACMLLAGLAATVLCARWYAALDRKTPRPTEPADRGDADRWLSGRRRNIVAVAIVSGVVFLALLIFGLAGGPAIQPPPSAENPAPKVLPPPAETVFKENESAPSTAHDWPRFRGPDGAGVVKAGDWPQKWDAASGENILWKVPVPAPGNSSPVLWGDRLFLTGAQPDLQKVLCFRRATGELLWQTAVFPARGEVKPEDITVQGESSEERPKERREERPAERPSERPGERLPSTTFAAPTPATDGERVYATFASADIAALDFAGRVLWQRNLGKPESSYGRATSLLIYKDKLIVQFDRGEKPEDGLSAMLALDVKTGKTVWSTPRPVRQSWCTPVLATVEGRVQLIAGGSPWLIAYDPDDGKELWRCGGMGADVAASPVFADGLVYFANENGGSVFAIRPPLNERGDVTQTNVVWTGDQGMSDTSSPACDGRIFLQANSSGRVTCYDAKDGRLFWDKDLGCTIWASPTIAGNLAYIAGENGKVYILDLAKAEFRLLATCNLAEPLYATPAFADGRIYFRGKKNLFCVGAAGSQP